MILKKPATPQVSPHLPVPAAMELWAGLSFLEKTNLEKTFSTAATENLPGIKP